MKSIARCLSAVVSLCLGGCGSGALQGDGGTADRVTQEPMPVEAGGDATAVDGRSCNAVIEMHPDEGASHIPCTSPATYNSEPPSSGNHYPAWAAYQTYARAIPWGNLVHNLEHGAIVIVYNCPDDCLGDIAAALAWIDALPPDPDCGANRIILAPDPTLSVRFAATAWQWTLRSDCFDPAVFTQFFTDHYSHGLELVCSSGASTIADLCPSP